MLKCTAECTFEKKKEKNISNNPPQHCRHAEKAAHIQDFFKNIILKNKKSAPQFIYWIKALHSVRLRKCAKKKIKN